MQTGFYFDQTRCTACYSCVVACKDWHNLPAGPVNYLRLSTLEKGKFPVLFVANMVSVCYQCANPACISVCPTSAISKRKMDGIVVVNKRKCLGKDSCGSCLKSCPYQAPQFGSEESAKMKKCDFCLDRLKGNKKPVCVDACPMRALDIGPVKQLRAKYGTIKEAEGFIYDRKLAPSVILKPKIFSG